MGFLHCHNCDWEQDDFWDWKVEWKRIHKWTYRPFGYNPFSLILEDVASNIKPCFQELDSAWAEEMGWNVKRHSWLMMAWSLKRHIKRIFNQKWWTYKGYLKAVKTKAAKCPGCGSSKDFDID